MNVVNTLRLRARLAFWSLDLTVIEFGQIALTWWWGLSLLAPGRTFDRPVYSVMHAAFGGSAWSEVAWGLVFLYMAICHTFCRSQGWLHQLVLFAGVFVWTLVALSSIMLYPLASAGGVYVLVAGGACWLFVRSGASRA